MDYTTDAHGEFTQAVEMQSLPEVMFEVEETQRKPYGKLVVLANHKLFMVSLGPDCKSMAYSRLHVPANILLLLASRHLHHHAGFQHNRFNCVQTYHNYHMFGTTISISDDSTV